MCADIEKFDEYKEEVAVLATAYFLKAKMQYN